ncbi:hypothetical protein [Halorussus sp. MSC15.2]|uniref:hypothetical protein n=1 Tax=Halorussus sp. MSC15.2 TaxID=2283638 RepID=UPI0013D83B66|nr:hypothetical protein [Halorussus sp. MSC15.2]NEU56915.1 hypothetical protein [Halorussus sp. MSC15.2]
MTVDRDEIETWADEHDAVPVREGDEVRLVPEDEMMGEHERLDWETFHREVDESDRVVTYHGDAGDRQLFEVTHRDDALERVTTESEEFDRDEAEQRLMEGETITGTVTETTVVEETIVEEATLESEVVDRETIERNVVDVDLMDRECQTCDITTEEADFDYLGTYGTDRFVGDDVTTMETGRYDEYPFDVTVEVREDWAVTMEDVDRYTVETRITDVDVTETDEVETRDLEARIDVESVHRQLLDSDVIDFDAGLDEGEIVDTETYDIESEFTDDDILTTYLTSRRRFERELSDRTRLTTDVVEGELLDREMVREEDIEAGLAERDAYETETEVETETVTETETEIETDEEIRVIPEESDEGKPVVNAHGDQIGEVVEAEHGVAYVDPHPSLTEKIMARLGADEDDEDYRLREDKIERITDDEVVVTTGVMDEELDDSR